MIRAYANNCKDICYHGSAGHAKWSMMIESSGKITDGTGVEPVVTFNEIHGWIMWAAWGVLGFL